MVEFIDEFGKENLYLMIAIVSAIVLVLIIILITEKYKSKRIMKSNYQNEINKIEEVEKEENTFKEEIPVINETPEPEEVYYVENEPTKEEAKEKLEEVTKKLIEEEFTPIDHTHFETEQEESSIISYDELLKASHDIDEKNDRLIDDENESAITLEELYKKHEENQNIIETTKNEEIKVNNPVFEEEPKKFKNSEVISPVFGVYSGKEKEYNHKDILKEINKNIEEKDLNDEIAKTEEFLTELKKLRSKLD